MRLRDFHRDARIYFIGIGGISMSALAKYLFDKRYHVSGSDRSRSAQTEHLLQMGIDVWIGEDGGRESLLQADLVVYTDAIPKENQELSRAVAMGKALCSRSELLEMVCKEFSKVISVAGSHGKTTCTSMCAHVLNSINAPFTAHIGGEDRTFGNYFSSGEEFFLTEACEYKKNLLKVPSNVAILLNIDKDHMECYKDEQDLIDSFRAYCQKASAAFVCADDEKCRSLGDFATFGIINSLSDYRAIQLRANGEKYSFIVEEYGKPLCQVRLNAIGRCNVYNALAAFAGMRALGFDEREIVKGLESFQSVRRRFEKIGEYKGASFICDYAHHPKEILSTVKTAKGICRGKLYVIFQPHTYSRTEFLMKEFVSVLRGIENLVIYKTFPAREKFNAEGSAKRLAQNVGTCLYAENVYVLKTWLKATVREKDIVLFLGAGDIYFAAQYLLNELK